jgi:hypothetical protein
METPNIRCFLCGIVLEGTNHLELKTKRCTLKEAKAVAESFYSEGKNIADAKRIIDYNLSDLANESETQISQEFFATCNQRAGCSMSMKVAAVSKKCERIMKLR